MKTHIQYDIDKVEKERNEAKLAFEKLNDKFKKDIEVELAIEEPKLKKLDEDEAIEEDNKKKLAEGNGVD